jgi:cell wall-associated NlpC family hydrolase
LGDVLRNPNLEVSEPARRALLAAPPDPRLAAGLAHLLERHRLTVSNVEASGPAGGIAMEVSHVDGEPVSAGNLDARDVAVDIAALDPSQRPARILTPWSIRGPGFATDPTRGDALQFAYSAPAAGHPPLAVDPSANRVGLAAPPVQAPQAPVVQAPQAPVVQAPQAPQAPPAETAQTPPSTPAPPSPDEVQSLGRESAVFRAAPAPSGSADLPANQAQVVPAVPAAPAAAAPAAAPAVPVTGSPSPEQAGVPLPPQPTPVPPAIPADQPAFGGAQPQPQPQPVGPGAGISPTAHPGGGAPDAAIPQGIPTGPGRSDVVAYAQQFLGTPYKWGGADPSTGFDCSGLVKYVYAHFGIKMDHFTHSQFAQFPHVDKADLQPGDIVFFDNVDHEGLYVGGGKFIQAPHTGDVVKISSLDDAWYASHYSGAVRPY